MCGGGSKKSSAPKQIPPGPTGPGYQVAPDGAIRDARSISTTNPMTSFGSELGGK